MQAVLLAILAGVCWGVGEIFTKAAINTGQVGPMGSLLVRALVTLPLAILAFSAGSTLLRTEPGLPLREVEWSTWMKLVVGSGVLAGFAGVFCFYWGLASPGGDISKLRPIAFALAPATAVLLGWWFLGEALSVRKIAAVSLILAGIVLLAGEKSHVQNVPAPSTES